MTTTLVKKSSYTAEKLLGIPVSDQMGLSQRVESGLKFSAFERLSRASGLSMDTLRPALRLTPRTMSRRRIEKRLSPEESDRLVSLSRLVALTFELFEGDESKAITWFTSPKRALGGATPLEMSITEVGSREVENLIGRIEHGVFS